MLKGIMEQLPEVYLNGDPEHRIPGNLNLSFAHVDGDALIADLRTLSVSSGSACASASLEPSYVLKALEVEEDLAHASVRIGLGRPTTEEEVDVAVNEIVAEVRRLRQSRPAARPGEEGGDAEAVEWAAR
jgi:cysteine desulfurase